MKDLTPNKADLDPIEIASRDEISALQLQRMKSTLAHAYNNVPFYKQKFDDAGVHPDDLKSLSDLSKFPFTVKTDLRDNYPFGMFAVPREQVSRIHASSGTTGKPTVVGYTKKTISTCGLQWLHVHCVQRVCAKAIFCTMLTAMACLPADWAHTMARRRLGVLWFPFQAA